METRKIDYYKTLKDIRFTDGFEIPAGKSLMFLQKEDDMINFKIEQNKCKRFFWLNESDVQFHHSKTEKWSKAKVIEHNIDTNETWLENEQKNTGNKGKAQDSNSFENKKDRKSNPGRKETAIAKKRESNTRKTTIARKRRATKKKVASSAKRRRKNKKA